WRGAEGEGWGRGELRRVEPFGQPVGGRAAFEPRTLARPVGALPRTEDPRVVLALRDDQRRAALEGRDAVDLPAGDEVVDDRRRVAEQLLALAEGQFVDVTNDQPLGDVLRRDRAFGAAVVSVLLVARRAEEGDRLR